MAGSTLTRVGGSGGFSKGWKTRFQKEEKGGKQQDGLMSSYTCLSSFGARLFCLGSTVSLCFLVLFVVLRRIRGFY